MSIQVEKITKRYGKQVALNQVSLEVYPNQITGFLGPNGAGKSTLMKIVTGVIPADTGDAEVCGLKVEAEKTDFRKMIGYLPENNPLYPEMYIREYLKMAAGFYKLKSALVRVAEVIEMTGLSPEAHKKIGALSKGYRQRVGIAQALIHNPKVLILDEPTSGLDPNQLEEIRNLIVRVSKDKTVLLSTHIMQEVEAVCNRVVIINKGNIIADGSTESIKQWSKGIGQQVRLETLDEMNKDGLSSLQFVGAVDVVSNKEALITSCIENDIRPLLFNAAVEKGWIIVSMLEETRSLENVFQELTQNA